MPRLEAEVGPSREPLTPTVKRALLALVIFFHVGGGWALTQVEPAKLIVGDVAPMEVRMVPAEQAADPRSRTPNRRPPVEIKPPDLAAIVEPPPGRPAAAGIPYRQDRHPAAGGAAAADRPAAREEAGPQARAAQAGAAQAAGAGAAGAVDSQPAAGDAGSASRAARRGGLAARLPGAAQHALSRPLAQGGRAGDGHGARVRRRCRPAHAGRWKRRRAIRRSTRRH